MVQGAGTSEVEQGLAAARSALDPWLTALADLKTWFDAQREPIGPGAAAPAEQPLTLLRATLEALARGQDAIPSRVRAAGREAPRIDTLLAGRPAVAPAERAERRRKVLFDLALWRALQGLPQAPGGGAAGPVLGRLHGALDFALVPAPGLSPSLDFACSASARGFFEQAVRQVLQALARKAGDGAETYLRVVPAQPFEAGVPSLVAWSQAWSVAVAGVFLDYLRRHAGDDPDQALRALWAGRFDAVRFRPGPGLTALPTHAGALHLDLWTCVVKAQVLAFESERWPRQAGGMCWHGVRIDMHELSAPAGGMGVESLYRVVFIDRLQAALAAGAWPDGEPSAAATPSGEHTIAIEMDRPHPGHLPNLRLLLRWRDPSGGPLRFAGDLAGDPSGEALRRWLARHDEAGPAQRLPNAMIDWRAPPQGATGQGPEALGHAALWQALPADVLWVDPALVVCVDEAWYELPVELHDDPAAGRTWWTLPPGADPLPGALDRATLCRAAGSAGALQWLATESGLGAFVMAALDVDAWRNGRSV
ncbi:MAG: hypothetical protein KF788_17270 [Piscinibacter sp.]|nr:hypothetical protein [Piscinibacter sp.]